MEWGLSGEGFRNQLSFPWLRLFNSSYALLKELQSKTEKKLVTSAAIAYGFFFLYKESRCRFLLLRQVGALRRRSHYSLSQAVMSLFPRFWTTESSYKGPWSMGFPQLWSAKHPNNRCFDLCKMFSTRSLRSPSPSAFSSSVDVYERSVFGLSYRQLTSQVFFTDLKLSTWLRILLSFWLFRRCDCSIEPMICDGFRWKANMLSGWRLHSFG